MKILHTSDWHVGKRIGRHDRIPEQQEAIAEVAEIADRIGADLVLHSGDLFDRPIPPVDALRAGLDGLLALTDGGELLVIEAGGQGVPIARYSVADSPTWAHPAVVDGDILIKDRTSLARYSFSVPSRPAARGD